MTALLGQQSSLALAGAVLWLVLALAIPRLPARLRPRQPGAMLWLLALAGVPVLGWLTMHWGPGPGLAAFGIGLVTLARSPLRRRAPARHRTPLPADPAEPQ